MTMKSTIMAASLVMTAASPLLADDARWRDCRTCHAVVAPDGTELVRGGRSGPNLFGITNAPLARDSGFRFYSENLRAAAQTGARWTEDNFIAYLTAPDQFLRDITGNPQAQSGMHVQLRSGAAELFRYLDGLSN